MKHFLELLKREENNMNKIETVNIEYLNDLVNRNNSNCHIAIIDGKENKDWDSYIKTIRKIYRFPTIEDNYDGYLDWMTDLSWLGADSFILIFFNYDELLSNDLVCRKIILDKFSDYILPWWDGEVEKYMVGGEKKDFNIFIVE